MADEGTDSRGDAGKGWKRRGILAAAGAVVAGMVAKQASAPVLAANVPIVVDNVAGSGVQNNVVSPLQIAENGGFSSTNVVKVLSSTINVDAIFGNAQSGATGKGVHGQTNNGYGVYGEAIGAGGYGVAGVATNAYGVFGQSSGGNGVYGIATAAGSTQVVAGVFGDSTASYGVIGRTTAVGYSGITGITTTPGAAAFAGTSTVPGAYAAYFQGLTVVQGNFAVVGGAKSAAVKDATGQHRLVYCVESPEAWFEDFGEATLTNGQASVPLDKTFAEVVHTDRYQVFLTDYGSSGHLSVPSRTVTGFVVQAEKAAASGTVGWRVVARRADIKGERLAKFDLPKINHPDPDGLPNPVPPKKP
jgi:hypothetical protein